MYGVNIRVKLEQSFSQFEAVQNSSPQCLLLNRSSIVDVFLMLVSHSADISIEKIVGCSRKFIAGNRSERLGGFFSIAGKKVTVNNLSCKFTKG